MRSLPTPRHSLCLFEQERAAGSHTLTHCTLLLLSVPRLHRHTYEVLLLVPFLLPIVSHWDAESWGRECRQDLLDSTTRSARRSASSRRTRTKRSAEGRKEREYVPILKKILLVAQGFALFLGLGCPIQLIKWDTIHQESETHCMGEWIPFAPAVLPLCIRDHVCEEEERK